MPLPSDLNPPAVDTPIPVGWGDAVQLSVVNYFPTGAARDSQIAVGRRHNGQATWADDSGLNLWAASQYNPVAPAPVAKTGTPGALSGISAESTANTLTVGLRPVPYLAWVVGFVGVTATVATTAVRVQLRQNGLGGTLIAGADRLLAGTGPETLYLSSASPVAANTAASFQITVQRISGTGTLSTVADGNFNSLRVLLIPWWPGSPQPS